MSNEFRVAPPPQAKNLHLLPSPQSRKNYTLKQTLKPLRSKAHTVKTTATLKFSQLQKIKRLSVDAATFSQRTPPKTLNHNRAPCLSQVSRRSLQSKTMISTQASPVVTRLTRATSKRIPLRYQSNQIQNRNCPVVNSSKYFLATCYQKTLAMMTQLSH